MKRSIGLMKRLMKRHRHQQGWQDFWWSFDYDDVRPFVVSVNDRTEHVWLISPRRAEVRRRKGNQTRTLVSFVPTREQQKQIESGRGTISILNDQIIKPGH